MQGLFDLNRSLPGENDLLLLVADLLVFESRREKVRGISLKGTFYFDE